MAMVVKMGMRSLGRHFLTSINAATRRNSRSLSMTSLDIDSESATGILTMDRKPVNSMTLEFLQEITDSIDRLEQEKCRGLILASALESVFCAGIDMKEFHKADKDRLNTFWFTFLKLISKIYSSPMTTVAAINGHSWAGGCLMALACDHRIMSEGEGRIGSNVVKLGIVAPSWLYSIMTNTIGQRETELAIQLGIMYSAENALRVGLVDKLVPREDIISEAKADIEKWLQIPDLARHLSKKGMRDAMLEKMQREAKTEADFLTSLVLKDSTQAIIAKHIKSLKKSS